jgi:hypothetical protein
MRKQVAKACGTTYWRHSTVGKQQKMREAGMMPQCGPNGAGNAGSNDIDDRLSRLARGSGVVPFTMQDGEQLP